MRDALRIAMESDSPLSLSEAFKKVKEEYELANPKIKGADYLNPPATSAQIKELEDKIGVKLPSEFVTLLKIANGQKEWAMVGGKREFIGGIFYYDQFLGTDGIIGEYQSLLDLEEQMKEENWDKNANPGPGIKDGWWNRKWIPFTQDGSGNSVMLDMDPGAGGKSGQVISYWHDDGDRGVKGKDVSDYLESVIADFVEEREKEEAKAKGEPTDKDSWVKRLFKKKS